MDTNQTPTSTDDNAADLIRQKVARIYSEEPDAQQELAEAEATPRRSKHQQLMHELSVSGKDLATVQTEWHDYYQSLSAEEKREVWQEFYASQSLLTQQASAPSAHQPQAMADHKHHATQRGSRTRQKSKLRDARSRGEIQAAIKDKVTAGGQLEAKHHLQSLLFGLSMGFIAVLIFLFGFFNEVVIAPFIQPSRASASTPLIVSTESVAPSSTPEVIIPKINVQIPVNYNQTTTDDKTIEAALDTGVVHYPTTSRPGQTGNAAFFGHSSNNIFNKGQYKFAFVMLHKMVEGDTFYLTYEGKVYVYKVISKQVVDPSNVGVLNPVPGQTATATLITCDPPGTSLKRLVVVGQQVSPDPGGNTAGSQTINSGTTTPTALPGNGPTLFGRFIGSPAGKIISVIAVLAAGWVALQRMARSGHLRPAI
jgi:sortase A